MKKGTINGVVDETGTDVALNFTGCKAIDMLNLYSHITARVLTTLVEVNKGKGLAPNEEEAIKVLAESFEIGIKVYCDDKENESEEQS